MRVLRFAEYITEFKGSDKYAGVFDRLMDYMRIPEVKDRIEDGELTLSYDELSNNNISIEELKKMDADTTSFYTFKMDFGTDSVKFSELAKKQGDRQFES